MSSNLLELILSDTYIKNQAEKKIIALKNYLLEDIFTTGKDIKTKKNVVDSPNWQHG
jgi:hypothetical protein